MKFFHTIATGVVHTFRHSRMARALLVLVIIKFFILYGVLKGFVYPRYLKPKWESEEQRSQQVMDDLLRKPNT